MVGLVQSVNDPNLGWGGTQPSNDEENSYCLTAFVLRHQLFSCIQTHTGILVLTLGLEPVGF